MKISVALCTYNGARYVDEQLRSILDQSRVPDEIVVSDDASSDGTLEHVRRVLAGSTVDAELIANPAPLGVTRNFQQALARTTGDVVLLSDQDDVWPVDRVARIEADLATSDALLRHSDARLVDAEGMPLGATLLGRLRVRRTEARAIRAGDPFPVYLRRNLATGATTAVRRELVDRAIPFPVEWVHDEWLAILAAAAGRIRLVPEPEIDYRQHGANQIGVAAPTLRYRIARVLGSTVERHELLATRAQVLAERLEELGMSGQAAEARGKAEFEARRAALPARRLARVPGILRDLLAGDYRRWASQRSPDALRDLARPGG